MPLTTSSAFVHSYGEEALKLDQQVCRFFFLFCF